MLRTRLSWLVIGGVAVILVAAAVDAIRSSEPSASSPRRETATERSAGKTTLAGATRPESLPAAPPRTLECQSTCWEERRPSTCATVGAARVTSLPYPSD
jgi:hypothetical protein